MRYLLVDAGNDTDWVKAKAHGMTGLYFPLSDPILDVKRRLSEAQTKGYAVGVYAAWNWGPYSETDGAGFAEWVDARLKELVAAGYVLTPSQPKVQLNNERHEPQVILDMLERWRQLRPKQDTSWTCEGMQGGWMSGLFASEVKHLKVRVVPQAYNGAMTEVWDPLAVARDLTMRGFPDALISPFYDAARLPGYWQGFAFTQGRLPV